MGKYSKLFNSQNEYDSFILSDDFVLPNVSYIVENDTVNFHPYVIDYKSQYLTFEAIENSTFKLTQNACEYSLDEGETWVSLAKGTNTPTVPAGSKIMLKATSPSISSSYGIGTFSSTGKFNVSGNIMSMLYGDDFVDKNDLTGKNYAFRYLFSGCTNVVEAYDLILPATTLAYDCYSYMFQSCSSLTTAPELPATTLARSCYEYMFQSCSSLTTAPSILPATTLADSCYSYMFYGCSSLITAPSILPATILADSCYSYMFSYCRSLTAAPQLPATTLARYCYNQMFRDCTGLVTAPQLPATILASFCYSYMFYGCTSLTTAPALPATTLASYCYNLMFKDCSSLNNIVMLARDISASSCLSGWVTNVASTGTFVKHKNMTSLSSGKNGIPTGWEVKDYQE